MVTIHPSIGNIKGRKGDSLRNPRKSGDNILVDQVITNQVTGAETVTPVDLGNFRGPAVVPGVTNVTVSGATNVAVLQEKIYVLTGSGTVTLTGEVGVMAAIVLATGMRVAGYSVPAGRWGVVNWPDTGWKIHTLSEPLAGDTTPPTPGALAPLVMDTHGLLRVSGAVDESAPHEMPYRFSTDGGSTYTAWQASASYVLSGLTPNTSYSFRHQVRDAALNVATGAVVTATTIPAATWTTRMQDTFTAADGTSMASRAPDVGTAWGAGTAVIRGNKFTGTGLDNSLRNALWSNGSAITQRVRITMPFALPISPPYGAVLRPDVGFNAASSNYFANSLNQTNTGVKSISMAMYGGGATWAATQLVTTIPESGTWTFDYHPTRRIAVVRVDSTLIGYFTGGTDLPFYGFVPQVNNNAAADDVKIEVSST